MSIAQSASVARISANVATILFGATILIQILLAAGVLPVTMAWGGRRDVLTPGLRIAGIVSAIVLGVFALIIRRRAGLLGSEDISTFIKVVAWVVTAYLAVNTFTNITSQSSLEKIVFIPISNILAIACFIVSIYRPQ